MLNKRNEAFCTLCHKQHTNLPEDDSVRVYENVVRLPMQLLCCSEFADQRSICRVDVELHIGHLEWFYTNAKSSF